MCLWEKITQMNRVSYLYSSLFSILVNGLPVGFSNSYNLRQGNSLSHLLFLFVMKALNKMIKIIIECGFLHSFSVENDDYGSNDISHMLFSNDAIVFCDINLGHIQSLRALFLCFKAILEMRVNLSKFKLVLVGIVPKVEFLSLSLRL